MLPMNLSLRKFYTFSILKCNDFFFLLIFFSMTHCNIKKTTSIPINMNESFKNSIHGVSLTYCKYHEKLKFVFFLFIYLRMPQIPLFHKIGHKYVTKVKGMRGEEGGIFLQFFFFPIRIKIDKQFANLKYFS